jgi:hypothetical protein
MCDDKQREDPEESGNKLAHTMANISRREGRRFAGEIQQEMLIEMGVSNELDNERYTLQVSRYEGGVQL